MLNSVAIMVVEAAIRISVIVAEVLDGPNITMVVVVFIKVIPTIISVPIHQAPNLGIQIRILVLPTRSATSLGTPLLTAINT